MPTIDRTKLYVVAHVDPAGGPRAGQQQYGLSKAAIVVVGLDDLERIFILETWAQRIPPDRLIERIIETYIRHKPAVFGIDASGPQLVFAQMVRRIAQERGVKLPLREVALKSNKEFSIETTIQPIAAAGRLFRPQLSECRSFKDEFDAFPGGIYLDQMDALACAIRLLPSVLPLYLRQMNENQLRSYLTRTGLPKEQVEDKIRQHQQQHSHF